MGNLRSLPVVSASCIRYLSEQHLNSACRLIELCCRLEDKQEEKTHPEAVFSDKRQGVGQFCWKHLCFTLFFARVWPVTAEGGDFSECKQLCECTVKTSIATFRMTQRLEERCSSGRPCSPLQYCFGPQACLW